MPDTEWRHPECREGEELFMYCREKGLPLIGYRTARAGTRCFDKDHNPIPSERTDFVPVFVTKAELEEKKQRPLVHC